MIKDTDRVTYHILEPLWRTNAPDHTALGRLCFQWTVYRTVWREHSWIARERVSEHWTRRSALRACRQLARTDKEGADG